MADDKLHIVIGICTRQRNTLLRRLIDGIQEQPAPDGYSVEIVVVDNNDAPVAESALAGAATRFPVSVEHEPQAGLVFARNRALDAATARNAAWFIGVDDDEWVASDWLSEMTNAIEALASPVLIGQCTYVYDDTLSPYLQPVQLQTLVAGERPTVLASGNYALHRRIFAHEGGYGMRFDPLFNESGGEDVEFFLRIEYLHGDVTAAVPNSIVFEACNAERATLKYRLKRNLRNQVAADNIMRQHRRLGLDGSMIKNAVRAVLRTNRYAVYGIGALMAGAAIVLFKRSKGKQLIGRGLERCVRAVAIIPFLYGMSPVGYGARVQTPAND